MALLVLGVILNRDWLAGFGLVAIMVGVILPRMTGGQIEATLTGVKGQLSAPSELLRLVRDKGRNLPADAIERAKNEVNELAQTGDIRLALTGGTLEATSDARSAVAGSPR